MSKRVRLGIDARIFSQPMSGVGRYLTALLDSLSKRDLFDIILFTDTPLRDEHKQQYDRFPVIQTDNIHDRKRWKNWILPHQLKEQYIDVYHATWDKGMPTHSPCPTVMSIHDLYYILPENEYLAVTKKKKRQFDLWVETSAARRIFTVSQCTKNDVMRYLGVKEDKIVVTYLDCDRQAIDFSLNQQTLIHPFQSIMDQGQYFVSVVGRLSDKRKNIPFLLRSFSKFLYRDQERRKEYKLLLVGSFHDHDSAYQELLDFINEKQLENNIILTGYLPDNELYPLLKKGKAMILASLFEGFGIPVLEAFYLDVPVITGNSCAMAEVAGEKAALLIDPTKEERLADALAQIVLNPALSNRLVASAQQRLGDFNWEHSIDKMIDVYQELAAEVCV